MAADGTIKIYTDIDEEGIKKGVVNVRTSIGKIDGALQRVGKNFANAFTEGAKKAEESVKAVSEEIDEKINAILNNSEKSAKSKAASIAAIYRKQGKSQTEAFKTAWEHIERESSEGSKEVKEDLEGIGEKARSVGKFIGNNISSGIHNVVRNIRNGISGLGSPVKNFNRSLSGTESQLKKIGGLVAGAFAVHKIIDFGRECLELGSDLQEVQNVVDSVFTTMSDKVDDFAQNAAISAGLSETMAKKFAGTFGAMAKSFGFAESEALEMSTTLTQLSGDVASFYNITQDEAYTKLKSVFTGETESLKELGVVMTQSALDSFAMANGFGKTTSAMTEQEKVALRYRFVMEQLSTASGDFLRTSDGWANQVRVLKLQIDSLKATIGQGMINMFTPAIKVINVLLAKFATVANAFKSFSELITGKKSSGNTGAAQAGIGTDDVAASYEDAASGAENLAAATDDVTDATKNAQKAQLKYLSTLDEVKKFGEDSNVDAGSSGNGTGTAGALGGLSAAVGSVDYGTLAEGETVLESSLNRLEELIMSKDWEGIGAYMADGINRGMEKIRQAISWDNVGPEIEEFTDAFTGIFNGFVEELDWDLAGRTVGTGINTIVNSMNGLIEKIHWKTLGTQFSNGITGIVTEVDWKAAGNLAGNKFMIIWNILYGAVKNAPYKKIGNSIATYLNGALEKIDFDEMGETLSAGFNGAFDLLWEFVRTFNWLNAAKKVSSGLNKMIHGIDWKNAGATLDGLFKEMLDSLAVAAEDVDWEGLGEGVGEFLSELDWEYYLSKVFDILKEVLGGIWKGLGETSAGKFIQAIIAFRIGTRLMPFVNQIVAFFTGTTVTQKLSSAFSTLFGSSLESGAGSAGNFSSALAPLVGEAGLIVAVGVAATYGLQKLSLFIEEMNGGNGTATTFGATMESFIHALQSNGDIIETTANDLFLLKESLEQEGMTSQEQAEATQKVIDKLAEAGVTSEQAENAFYQLYQQGSITSDMFDILQNAIGMLSDETTNMAGAIDLGNEALEKGTPLWKNLETALFNVGSSMFLTETQQDQLTNAMYRTLDAGGSAQEAYLAVMEAAEDMGLNTESVAKIFAEVFPEAVQQTKTAVSTHITGAQKTVSSATAAMSSDVAESASEMQTSVSDELEAIQEDTETYFGNVSDSTVTNWGGSSEEVRKNVRQMKLDVSSGLAEVDKTVTSHFTSQYNIMTDKWKYAAERITGKGQILDQLYTSIKSKMESIVKSMQSAGTRMGNGLSNGVRNSANNIVNILNDMIREVNTAIRNINGSISSVERAFTFSYDVTNPVTGARSYGNYWLNLPEVSSVPYLASGAVIPPNAPFMAVLGDQRNGTNLEAPESTIRQIFREELADVLKNIGTSGNGIHITAQINRRTVFDEFIEEAKLRQMQTGRNPLELT